MVIKTSMDRTERDRVLGDFKTDSTAILVATDDDARGLDVDDVKFIIYYAYPNNSEDYIHRLGEIFVFLKLCINDDQTWIQFMLIRGVQKYQSRWS